MRRELPAVIQQMIGQLDQTPHLQRLGRLFNETVLIEIGGQAFYLTFEKGRVVECVEGASSKMPWRFGVKASEPAIREFWKPFPKPGYHDIFGLVKYGEAKIEGDILVLVKNLRFFKEFLALGKVEANHAS